MKLLNIKQIKKNLEIKVSKFGIKRLEKHGFGLFLKDIKKHEVCITKGALEILMDSPERSGLKGLEFWPHNMMAWGMVSAWLEVPIDEINVPPEAKKWIKKLFKVV